MSQAGSKPTQEPTLSVLHDSLSVQAKLTARQAKRATKAASRREKSDALKEEGNVFFRDGNFQDAVNRYQQAIDVHRSAQPVLLADLTAAYLKLGMYHEAHDAADRALKADPMSVKARYHRGIARKHLKMRIAADTDFRTLLVLDPGNKDAEAELASFGGKHRDPSFREEEEDFDSYPDLEAPGLRDEPELGESLSESSDCEHSGNGIPCKFYNRSECRNGHACRYSHAPDDKSERDALGRNVCRYYLMSACKFGDRCSYLHSKEYLLQGGWWSTAEGVDEEKRRYNLVQKCNKEIADYNKLTTLGTGQKSKEKQAKGQKKRNNRSRLGLDGSGSGARKTGPSEIGLSSQRTGTKGRKIAMLPSYSRWGGYDSDGDDGRGMCGFSSSEVDELVCHGVKPWDDDAWDVLHMLHDY